jgi:hypothetical protein
LRTGGGGKVAAVGRALSAFGGSAALGPLWLYLAARRSHRDQEAPVRNTRTPPVAIVI